VTNLNKVSGDFAQISDSIKKANLGKTVKELNATIAKVINGIMKVLSLEKEQWVN
jgi:phospholipid/cholesterol/gamma-HCH transport system substrate-binding protein